MTSQFFPDLSQHTVDCEPEQLVEVVSPLPLPPSLGVGIAEANPRRAMTVSLAKSMLSGTLVLRVGFKLRKSSSGKSERSMVL